MHVTINCEQTEFPYHLPDGQVKIKVIAIPYIILYNDVKVIRQFGCFSENFVDEGDNLVNNPNICKVEGNTKLSSGLHQVATPDNRKCV